MQSVIEDNFVWAQPLQTASHMPIPGLCCGDGLKFLPIFALKETDLKFITDFWHEKLFRSFLRQQQFIVLREWSLIVKAKKVTFTCLDRQLRRNTARAGADSARLRPGGGRIGVLPQPDGAQQPAGLGRGDAQARSGIWV